jgi:hypothetical protein
MGNGVFLDVVDDDLRAVEFGEVRQRIEREAGALELVLEVRRVDEDRQVVIERELDVLLEDGQLVAGVLVEADLADAEHGRARREIAG